MTWQGSKDEEPAAPSSSPQDLATAYRELTKGEQTAAQLEANLTNLESKLDAMLAAFEQQGGQGQASAGDKTSSNSNGSGGGGGGGGNSSSST